MIAERQKADEQTSYLKRRQGVYCLIQKTDKKSDLSSTLKTKFLIIEAIEDKTNMRIELKLIN